MQQAFDLTVLGATVWTVNGPERTDIGIRGGRIAACLIAGIRWTRTKPYHPWTNGRAEAFIGTLQRECLYEGRFFTHDEERRYAIAQWIAFYNATRPHTRLGGLAPAAWLRARGVTDV